jgi:hypothetical protein
MEKMNFNYFCHKYCDGLYNPNLPDELQNTGYVNLKKMVLENINPSSLDEIKRWETKPTTNELLLTPDIKYLRFLHPSLRPFIIEYWEIIKTLNVT